MGTSMIWTLILFLAILSLLVLVHEFGHFFMARRAGMKVEEFGFGFPPRLFGVKRGGTLYSINAIPLGGFVKIKGESGAHGEEVDSFAHKSGWQRFSVLIAGVAMNLVLAVVLFSIGFMTGLPTVTDEPLPQGAHVREEAIRIVQVLPDSPADRAGLRVGDVVESVNDRLFSSAPELYDYVGTQEEGMVFLVQRGEEHVTSTLSREAMDGAEGKILGVALVRTGFVSYGFFPSLLRGVMATGQMTIQIVVAFAELIQNLVTTASVSLDVSGPVGIAVMTGEAAHLGLPYLIQFAALLSINLAVINVLPFPALDGGRILFLLIEKIRRRKVGERVEAMAHNLGFLLLISLVILVTYRDLAHFGGGLFDAIKSIF